MFLVTEGRITGAVSRGVLNVSLYWAMVRVAQAVEPMNAGRVFKKGRREVLAASGPAAGDSGGAAGAASPFQATITAEGHMHLSGVCAIGRLRAATAA